MVDTRSVEWTEEQEKVAIAVLEKIVFCQDQGKLLPGHVFEAHVRSKKSISTELVLFNERDEIYLVKRPSLEENPSEAYPNQWHNPGVILAKNESLEDTFKRLRTREGVRFANLEEIGIFDARDHRGWFLLRVFIARAIGEQANPKGRWFKKDEIPWEGLVNAQREVILPKAIEAYEFRYVIPR
jgi:ADP-ribose pyrophosphatase YjhB (NUDIX family)